jgi:hypothetical protein
LTARLDWTDDKVHSGKTKTASCQRLANSE